MQLHPFRLRALLPAALLGVGIAAAGCDSVDRLLEVQNPGVIGEAALDDPDMIPSMVNSAVGEFQIMYDDLLIAGAILSDEAVNGHNFEQWRQFDLRQIERTNTILGSEIYGPLQRARAAADDYAGRIRNILGDEANSHFGLSRVHAYAGYGRVILGEYFCEAPVRPDEPALTSEQILEQAIQQFDQAIQVATAARAAGTAAVRADSIINLARVGAARAHLWLGNNAQAAQYASQVPADFRFWVAYATTTSAPNNRLFSATNGASRFLGVDAKFRNLDDPRVRHTATSGKGHNGLTDLWDPMIGVSHSGWNPATPARFELGTNVLLASGLEARYILAEAGGMNDAELLAFINERRAVGNQGVFVGVGQSALLAELRDQRRRDLFLSGHRLGDLRRYLKNYNVDEFPSGAHPNDIWGSYGDATCFIPHNNERIGNPNYRP